MSTALYCNCCNTRLFLCSLIIMLWVWAYLSCFYSWFGGAGERGGVRGRRYSGSPGSPSSLPSTRKESISDTSTTTTNVNFCIFFIYLPVYLSIYLSIPLVTILLSNSLSFPIPFFKYFHIPPSLKGGWASKQLAP